MYQKHQRHPIAQKVILGPIVKLDQHFLTEEFKNVSFCWLAWQAEICMELKSLKEDHPRINPMKLVKF